MGNGYTRQSAAQIAPGNSITADGLEDEFDALEGAFNGSTGHTHDGTIGEGPLIGLTTSVTGVLPVANGGFAGIHNLNATSAPTVNDDSGDGYVAGSIWIDVTNDVGYICLDATLTAAVWFRPQAYGSYATLTDTDQTVTGGSIITSLSLGTISSGTVTPDPGDRPMQHYINGGAHTLAPSSNSGIYTVDITNNASAGAITTSGWTSVQGDSFTTVNGDKFRCTGSVGNVGSLLIVIKL